MGKPPPSLVALVLPCLVLVHGAVLNLILVHLVHWCIGASVEGKCTKAISTRCIDLSTWCQYAIDDMMTSWWRYDDDVMTWLQWGKWLLVQGRREAAIHFLFSTLLLLLLLLLARLHTEEPLPKYFLGGDFQKYFLHTQPLFHPAP